MIKIYNKWQVEKSKGNVLFLSFIHVSLLSFVFLQLLFAFLHLYCLSMYKTLISSSSQPTQTCIKQLPINFSPTPVLHLFVSFSLFISSLSHSIQMNLHIQRAHSFDSYVGCSRKKFLGLIIYHDAQTQSNH